MTARFFCAAALLAVAALPAAAMEDRITRSARAKAGGTLTLDTEYGASQVIPGDASKG